VNIHMRLVDAAEFSDAPNAALTATWLSGT
jgi:hypothetical protein